MNAEHALVLVLVIVGLFVLVRWGGAIFLIYACLHFIAGEWFYAGVAFFLACFFEFVRALTNWFDWNSDGRSEWLKRANSQDFTHARWR